MTGDRMTLGRRSFLKAGAAAAAAAVLPGLGGRGGAGQARVQAGRDLVFRPFPAGAAPRELGMVYLTDQHEDPFRSTLTVTREGITVPASHLEAPFSVNARWFVEGFGYLWLAADNGGKFLPYKRDEHYVRPWALPG